MRLLSSRHNVKTFLENTDEADISREAKDFATRLAAITGDDDISRQKRTTLADMLVTVTTRKDNFQKAKGLADLVSLQLEHVQTKLVALSELSVTRQDPAAMAQGITDAARDVETTEAALSDLKVLSNLSQDSSSDAPDILRLPAASVPDDRNYSRINKKVRTS